MVEQFPSSDLIMQICKFYVNLGQKIFRRVEKVKSMAKNQANSNSNSKLELDDFEVSKFHGDLICRFDVMISALLQDYLTRSPAVARMADCSAPVVKLTLTLILPGSGE